MSYTRIPPRPAAMTREAYINRQITIRRERGEWWTPEQEIDLRRRLKTSFSLKYGRDGLGRKNVKPETRGRKGPRTESQKRAARASRAANIAAQKRQAAHVSELLAYYRHKKGSAT